MPLELSEYRSVDPERIMELLGYVPSDRYGNSVEYRLADDRKISITVNARNAKGGNEYLFQCWNGETFRTNKRGGAGAIDLVMAVTGKKFIEAVYWLAHNFFSGSSPAPVVPRTPPAKPKNHTMPSRNVEGTEAMNRYLCKTRGFPERLVAGLLEKGIIYPNVHRYVSQGKQRSFVNAVFVMRNDETGEPVGSMIRGCFDGKEPRKSTLPLPSGFESAFWVGSPLATASTIVLTESPIECLSYLVLHPLRGLHCRTYGGNRWRFVTKIFPILNGRKLVCAFNNDKSGQDYAAELTGLCQAEGIELAHDLPEAKDWNEQLRTPSPLSQPVFPPRR